jgi:hypothetical protein
MSFACLRFISFFYSFSCILILISSLNFCCRCSVISDLNFNLFRVSICHCFCYSSYCLSFSSLSICLWCNISCFLIISLYLFSCIYWDFIKNISYLSCILLSFISYSTWFFSMFSKILLSTFFLPPPAPTALND